MPPTLRAPQTWPHQTCPVSTGPFLGSVFRFQQFPDLHASNSVPCSGVRFGCSQKFRTSFRSSFSSLSLGFCAQPDFPFFPCFPPFPVFKSRSGIPVFPCFPLFPPFPVFRGPNPEFRFFRFFRFLGLQPGIPGSRLRPRSVRPRLARTDTQPLKNPPRSSLKNKNWEKESIHSQIEIYPVQS